MASTLMINQSEIPDHGVNIPRSEKKEEIIISEAQTTEEVIRERFKDIPILAEISKCESRFIQFDLDGSIHRGRVNSNDVGAMQINTYYHLETSKKLGYDIFTLEGNMDYAEYLYKKEGTRPWSASKPCWGGKELAMK